jgi:hypothetical protein
MRRAATLAKQKRGEENTRPDSLLRRNQRCFAPRNDKAEEPRGGRYPAMTSPAKELPSPSSV